ncbi:MAG: hypothetical protein HY289_16040 [Planctomycetes bacterium]|nr:hypothetical protein [Planctomycetota bacterium]
MRRLRCAIEQIVDWHAELYVEPHVVAFVAVAARYSESPALFDVDCDGLPSPWLRGANEFELEISWHRDTARNAERIRATMQPSVLVELAAIGVALILGRRIVNLGPLDVTELWDRADYRARKHKAVLEISGTEVSTELGRRHREKIDQALRNPFKWDAYVAVCAFSGSGHRVRFSKNSVKEARHE